MAGQSMAVCVARKILKHNFLKFGRHIVIHLKIIRPRRFSRIHIESSAETKVVVAIRIIGNALAARTRIRRHQHDAELSGNALCAAFDHEIFFSARQA